MNIIYVVVILLILALNVHVFLFKCRKIPTRNQEIYVSICKLYLLEHMPEKMEKNRIISTTCDKFRKKITVTLSLSNNERMFFDLVSKKPFPSDYYVYRIKSKKYNIVY